MMVVRYMMPQSIGKMKVLLLAEIMEKKGMIFKNKFVNFFV